MSDADRMVSRSRATPSGVVVEESAFPCSGTVNSSSSGRFSNFASGAVKTSLRVQMVFRVGRRDQFLPVSKFVEFCGLEVVETVFELWHTHGRQLGSSRRA